MIRMTIWRPLRDAYGTAGPVEALLERGDTEDRAIWDELWSRLCHQGTVYSASYAALPRLAELAARQDPSGFVDPLFLATCIVASTDGPEESAAVRVRYAETIRALHDVAEGLVPFAADDADFVYRVQAVLATESDSLWATRLEALANQELEFACPGCDEQLVMGLETSPALVKQFDDASGGRRLRRLTRAGSRVARRVPTNWQLPTGDRRLPNSFWTFSASSSARLATAQDVRRRRSADGPEQSAQFVRPAAIWGACDPRSSAWLHGCRTPGHQFFNNSSPQRRPPRSSTRTSSAYRPVHWGHWLVELSNSQMDAVPSTLTSTRLLHRCRDVHRDPTISDRVSQDRAKCGQVTRDARRSPVSSVTFPRTSLQ
jgi:hypothetical protein